MWNVQSLLIVFRIRLTKFYIWIKIVMMLERYNVVYIKKITYTWNSNLQFHQIRWMFVSRLRNFSEMRNFVYTQLETIRCTKFDFLLCRFSRAFYFRANRYFHSIVRVHTWFEELQIKVFACLLSRCTVRVERLQRAFQQSRSKIKWTAR